MSADNALAIAAVAVVPLVALMLSAFVKISVVLALLRNALGAPDAPPALVVTGLAFVVTGFVMAPVAEQVVQAVVVPAAPGTPAEAPRVAPGGKTPAETPGTAPGAKTPAETSARPELPQGAAGWLAAAGRAAGPVRGFLSRHVHAEDRATFLALARDLRGPAVADDDLLVLAAGFVTSELTEAFAIAFLVFLPFLVIDLVVGIGLGALGLSATPPATVALPLKLLLFVAVDGWRLLVEGLVRGYL